jgi:tryptophan synthase alpha chain
MKNNRLKELFASGRKNLLSVYFTAGYPQLTDTVRIAKALEEAGADFLEIGIPFSDPVADGPTIQASNKVALDNGMHLHLLVEQVAELRQVSEIPVILMGYLNPLIQYGVEAFCADAAAAGADGLILPDMPLEEFMSEYKPVFDKHNLQNTFLISPTTSEERIRRIDDASTSFIYAVAASSTTGAKERFTDAQIAYFKRLKAMNLKHPVMIGFGIANATSFGQACEYGTGAIVGSAFINVLRESKNLEHDIAGFVKSLKNGKGI